MKQDNKAFYQGAAAVLGALSRTHGQPYLAVQLMCDLGISMMQLEKAGVENFDLELIRKEMSE